MHLIVFILGLMTGMAQANPCPFQSYLEAEKEGPKYSSKENFIQDRSIWIKGLNAEFQKGAHLLFNQYLEDKLKPEDIACIQSSSRLKDLVEINLASELINDSVEMMTKSKSIKVQTYATTVKKLIDSGYIMPTRLNLHVQNASQERIAGFDRNNRGIFFNLLQINPDHYFIYLIHEFSHSLDPTLNHSINEFNDSGLTKAVAELVRTQKTSGQLSVPEKNLLNRYVMAGLNRGLFAEVRAWVMTSELYLDLLQQEEQAPVPFLDEILKDRKSATTNELEQIWWAYLSHTFTAPEEGLFHSPLLKDAVTNALNQEAVRLQN